MNKIKRYQKCWVIGVQRELKLYDVKSALEAAIVELADREERHHRAANKYRAASLVLVTSFLAFHFLDIDTLESLSGVLAVLSTLGWLSSWAAFQGSGQQLATLDGALSKRGIYIGGTGREVRITTNPYDTPQGHRIGEWLTSSSPDGAAKDG